jgi:hypothetical protein
LTCSPSLRIVSQADDKSRRIVKFGVQIMVLAVNERVGYVLFPRSGSEEQLRSSQGRLGATQRQSSQAEHR